MISDPSAKSERPEDNAPGADGAANGVASPAHLRGRGLALCKPDPESKSPTYKEWTTGSLEADDFGAEDLTGVICGPLSDGNRPGHALVNIDLDGSEALKRADDFLPATAMVEGKPDKPDDHRYYLVPCSTIPESFHSRAAQAAPAAKARAGHPGPWKKAFSHAKTKTRVIDFIGTGGQAVCPSTANRRRWVGGSPGEPAVVPFPQLWEAVNRLAKACGCEPQKETSDRAKHNFVYGGDREDVIDRARKYLAKIEPAVSGQGGHDKTFYVACKLVGGFELSQDEARPLMQEYSDRCDPHWTDKEIDHKLDDADKQPGPRGYLLNADQDVKFTTGAKNHQANGRDAAPVTPEPPPWPDPPAEEAFHGLAGRIVRTIEPASEADPSALLVQLLVAFGNVIGRGAHFTVEADWHRGNEYAVLVGKTSKARKGTSWGRIDALMQAAAAQWAAERVHTGLSSGEGLIWAVRDPITKMERVKERGEAARYEEVEADPGVEDKRLLVYEPEFANVLKQTERQGNTLSAVLRVAWDGRNLRSMTKNSPARATGAHVSLIGHITADELRRYLTQTETANGFGNRHLWVCSDRSKRLPEGGVIDPAALAALQDELVEALAFARSVGDVRRDDEARAVWCEVYGDLSEGKPGLAGALLARGEAHVMRLALLYALLDRSALIRGAHLLAGLAFWEYVERSVYHVFGDTLGDPIADDLLRLLRSCPKGLTRTDIRDYFQRNASADRIGRALGTLLQHRLARREEERTGGRPSERWYAIVRKGG